MNQEIRKWLEDTNVVYEYFIKKSEEGHVSNCWPSRKQSETCQIRDMLHNMLAILENSKLMEKDEVENSFDQFEKALELLAETMVLFDETRHHTYEQEKIDVFLDKVHSFLHDNGVDSPIIMTEG